MAGIPSDAFDLRRNLRRSLTVTTFPFESGVGNRSLFQMLSKFRALCDNLRIGDGDNFKELSDLVNEVMVKTDVSLIVEFEILCEAMISLLYFGLAWNETSGIVQFLYQSFLDKCFESSDSHDINQLVLEINENYKSSLLACVLLLSNQYNFHINEEMGEVLLKWKTPQLEPPKWLNEILSSRINTYDNLRYSLLKSLYFSWPNETVDELHNYLNSLCSFFESCNSYRNKNHDMSINILNKIDPVKCSEFLNAMINLVTGMNLAALGKPQSALLKYRDALNHSGNCIYALYFSSSIFWKFGLVDAHLECLKMLKQVDSKNLCVNSSFQAIMINCHLPSLVNLKERATWLLANSCWYHEKWNESRDQFQELILNWDSLVPNTESNLAQILPPADQIPDLPACRDCVVLGCAVSLLSSSQYAEVEQLLKDITIRSGDISSCLQETDFNEQLSVFSHILCLLTLSDSLFHEDRIADAITTCSRIILPIESLYATGPEQWINLVLLTKVYAFKLFSSLHRHSGDAHRKSANHFQRLQEKNSVLLKGFSVEFMAGNLDDIFMENARKFICKRIKLIG